MIDLKQELQNYQPIDLKSLANNMPEISDNIKNSIVLYNKALDNLKNNSEDIAIIELKKAISMNPHFHEAMNLLGICYGYVNDYNKANEMFKKVIEEENNAVKALRYLELTGSGKLATSLVENKRKTPRSKPQSQKDPGRNSEAFLAGINKLLSQKNLRTWIPGYAASFIVGVLIMLLISSLSGSSNNDTSVFNGKNENTAAAASTQDSFEQKYNKLNEDFEKLQAAYKAASTDIDYYKNVVKLFEIESLAGANKYEEAADKLLLLKSVDFREAEKSKYDSLYKSVMAEAARTVFNEGNRLFGMRKYQEAADKLSKLQVYAPDSSYNEKGLYNLGKCYVALNDSRSAVAAFQKLKEGYPRSQYARWAEYKIQELTSEP
ncbi:MAG: tetratricopeptide repeat protein [Clostridia bacterium]|nr:tetratricopeptide repeat protein [Clostridia bacterium]